VADILEFPQVGRRAPRARSGVLASLRDSIERLDDATAALRRSRDDLIDRHDALDGVRGQLLAQVAGARIIAGLARAIEDAIAADDAAAIAALQAELKTMLDAHAAHAPILTDAAD